MHPVTIGVAGAIGDHRLAEADGERLYDLIRPVLLEENRVILDFSGVETITPSFFEVGIGRLLRIIPFETLIHHLLVENLTLAELQLLEQVLAAARDTYGSNHCLLCRQG